MKMRLVLFGEKKNTEKFALHEKLWPLQQGVCYFKVHRIAKNVLLFAKMHVFQGLITLCCDLYF